MLPPCDSLFHHRCPLKEGLMQCLMFSYGGTITPSIKIEIILRIDDQPNNSLSSFIIHLYFNGVFKIIAHSHIVVLIVIRPFPNENRITHLRLEENFATYFHHPTRRPL